MKKIAYFCQMLALLMFAGGGLTARADTGTLLLQISGLGRLSITSSNGVVVEDAYTNTALDNYSNAVLQIGTTYKVAATPATNFVFGNWVLGTNGFGVGLVISTNPLFFVMETNLALQANFLPTTPPKLAITSPITNQICTNVSFTAQGTTTNRYPIVAVWYSLNGDDWTNAVTTNNWTNWSAGLTLTPDFNVLQAYAEDTNGNFSATNSVSFVYANGSSIKLITFDDLPTPGKSGVGTVTNGYSGLQWTNFGYLIGRGAGWQAGTVSGKVAFNNSGSPAVLASTNGAFDLSSAFLTAAYNDGLTVTILGFTNLTANYSSNYVYSNSFDLSSSAQTLVDFGCSNVTEVYFSASGGTPNVNYGGLSGTQFVMDNLLITTEPPAITNQPPSETLALSNSATLTAGVSGGTPMTFFWRKNGVILTNNADVSGVDTSTLSFAAITSTDAGYYTLFAKNAYGSAVSLPAVINVAQPITISSPPQSVTICAGEEVIFSVTASWTNSAALTYQWYAPTGAIAGATASSYTNLAAGPNDSGNYAVVVGANGLSSTFTNSATLTVNQPPFVAGLVSSTNQTLYAGQSTSFAVNISSALPATCQWLTNSVPVAGATNTILALTNISDANAANYSVIASNPCGNTTNFVVTLAVNDTPFIYQQPASQIVGAGANVTFTVGAYGGQPLFFQWYYNGAKIGSPTGNPTLALTDVQTNQAGNYSVNAFNGYTLNPAVSSNAVLTVAVPPQLTIQPSSGYLLLSLYATPGGNYVLQYSTNLSSATNWTPFYTNDNLPGSPAQFLIPIPPGPTNQFYQAIETF